MNAVIMRAYLISLYDCRRNIVDSTMNSDSVSNTAYCLWDSSTNKYTYAIIEDRISIGNLITKVGTK